jgi:hypothetical protein
MFFFLSSSATSSLNEANESSENNNLIFKMINLYVSYNQFVFDVSTSKLERFSFICLFNDLSDLSATLKAL